MNPWGKASRENPQDRHHLAHHCADVAAVFLELCVLPVIRQRLEQTAGRALSNIILMRLAVIVFLHDVGKLNAGFQSKVWPEPLAQPLFAGHIQEGMDLLNSGFRNARIPRFLHLPTIFGWAEEERIYDYLRASISHHGSPAPHYRSADRSIGCWRPQLDYDPAQAAEQFGQAMTNWFPEAFSETTEQLPDSPRFIHLFSGLVSLADWIGSDRSYFEFVSPFDPDYIHLAKARAQQIVRDIGLNLSDQRAGYNGPASFHDVTTHDAPNAHQQAIARAPVSEQLLILEAETGAGKTEAALLRFIHLWEAGYVDGLYFAVPTRAAALQLHRRVDEAARRTFKEQAPETVLAVPGYIKAGEVGGQSLPGYQVLWDDDKSRSSEQLARRWAAEHSKRYLAAQIAVGTVDQAMLAALPVKHAHLRAASLSRSLLVIDEVHASDPYMTEIQTGLLEMHLAVGGYALLMSATLGERARAKWLGQPQKSLGEAVNCPYPAIWSHDKNIPVAQEDAPAGKQVHMTVKETKEPADSLEAAIAAAEKGAKVLIIRNTVTLAVDTLKVLEVMDVSPDLLFRVTGVPTLHHGRFAPEDRKRLDKAVEDNLGKERKSSGGKIIIGTQTLEQSLDIDADLLITDLCPADVLLQRIGRLYRHRSRADRPLPRPECIVLVPDGGLSRCLKPKPCMINGLGAYDTGGALTGIYIDLVTLEATRRLIERHPVWKIPEMNRSLVEQSTHPEAQADLIKELPEDWAEYHNRIFGKEAAESQHAAMLWLDPEMPFGDLSFPTNEEQVRTRLGGEGITVIFSDPPPGPFGDAVSQLTLPEHWSTGLDPQAEPQVLARENGQTDFTFCGRNFIYGRYGLEKRKNADV